MCRASDKIGLKNRPLPEFMLMTIVPTKEFENILHLMIRSTETLIFFFFSELFHYIVFLYFPCVRLEFRGLAAVSDASSARPHCHHSLPWRPFLCARLDISEAHLLGLSAGIRIDYLLIFTFHWRHGASVLGVASVNSQLTDEAVCLCSCHFFSPHLHGLALTHLPVFAQILSPQRDTSM